MSSTVFNIPKRRIRELLEDKYSVTRNEVRVTAVSNVKQHVLNGSDLPNVLCWLPENMIFYGNYRIIISMDQTDDTLDLLNYIAVYDGVKFYKGYGGSGEVSNYKPAAYVNRRYQIDSIFPFMFSSVLLELTDDSAVKEVEFYYDGYMAEFTEQVSTKPIGDASVNLMTGELVE